jgi:hypothetical protein
VPIFWKKNSAEFLGKTVFRNFFRIKFLFSPTFFWGKKIPQEFPRNFPRKKCTKNRPLVWKFVVTLRQIMI